MKAKDIALLCTAAAGAGAAAGAAVGAAGKKNKTVRVQRTEQKKSQPSAPAAAEARTKKTADTEAARPAEIFTPSLNHDERTLIFTGADCECGIAAAVYSDGRDYRAFRISDNAASEIRCPSKASGAASTESCTAFITDKGIIFVYADPDREPVYCAVNSPEYICAFGGDFYVFSDCLLYICSESGEIRKTVSLCALIAITGSDICDAENSDDSFSSSEVHIKKAVPFTNTSFAAVITTDGRSYLMHCDDDFCAFEKTYEHITDVCTYGSFAYYLYESPSGYGIIKTRIGGDSCETEAKYHLCGSETAAIKLISGRYGIGVLYGDGRVRFLLPEISNENERAACHTAVKRLNAAFADITAEDIFSLGSCEGFVHNGNISLAIL